MITISVNYNIDFTLKDYSNIGVTNKGIVINLQRGKTPFNLNLKEIKSRKKKNDEYWQNK